MIMGRCCRCFPAGTGYNWRVYNFTTGVLLWKDQLQHPLLATDGTVYAKTHTVLSQYGDSAPLTFANTPGGLKHHSATSGAGFTQPILY